jgi:demethylmenaquinone methyltransferase/2-methoxy-6-polyprenyl-1,4-benzoquinol methylase
MFDRIAFRYDTLNRILSLGLDRRWRRRVARYLPRVADLRVLDLATGTGDQLLAFVAENKEVAQAVGMDLAEEMLVLGRAKIEGLGLQEKVTLSTGDACALPVPDATFHAASISFGIRNVPDVPRCLREMHRVLRPGGRALVLEFSLPPNRALRAAHLFYLRHVLPRVGGWLSGDHAAYRYLNRTIESFPYGEAFCERLRDAGFDTVEAYPMNGGIVTLYVGERGPGETAP